MRTRILLTVLGTLLLGNSNARAADERVALVIGNSTYSHAAALANPANDANAVSMMLDAAGFKVDMRNNLPNQEMRRAIREFSVKAAKADVAVVFYAGHGMEVDGNNYLIPIDAVLATDLDAEDEAISLDRIMRMVEPAKRFRLVILDACRDNPFVTTMKRTLASRSIGRGLARPEPTTSDTLIAYAAKAGSTASDSDGDHSPFTNALLKHLATPGLDLRIALGFVRDEVLARTGAKQEPFVYGSLGGATIALVPTETTPAVASAPVMNPNGEAWRDYEHALKIGTQEVWDMFLATHPTGFYANLAHAQRAKLLTTAPGPAGRVPLAEVGPPSAPPAVAAPPKQKTASRSEPETSSRSLTRHGSEKPAARKKDEKPAARTKERPTRSSARSGGSGACAYVRRAVRTGTAAGLDNGHGLIAFGRSLCGG